ncbi:hypothetical protein E2I00_002764, partial [Balaenoptera physalus]
GPILVCRIWPSDVLRIGVTEGYNGTIFAYGQTGSGKSFTMQGLPDPPCQRGIIPRAFEHIFESVQCAENTKFLVRASYLEIYNEDVRDLLGTDTKQKLEVGAAPTGPASGRWQDPAPPWGRFPAGCGPVLHARPPHPVASQLVAMATTLGLASRRNSYQGMRARLAADTWELKEHPEKGAYVKGLSMHTVHSVAQCERVMETGWKNRSVGYTLMNKDSSRSHSIFTISIEIYAVALLNNQVPPNPVQIEEKLLPPSVIQHDTEAEKQLIREEYEERLARLRADYEAEQESRARLEEDITAMRNSYDVKLSTLEENLRKETEAVLKAEVLYKAEVMSRAEFASSSEYSPTFQYKMAVKPEIYSMPGTLPSEGVFKTEGPVPEVEAPSGHFLDEDVSQEATEPLWEEEPFPQGEEPHPRALELLPGLHDPFAEVEAKLARLSSTVAGLDVPQADVPEVATQVADVTQDAMGAELSWGTEVIGHHPSRTDLLEPGDLRSEAEAADDLLPRTRTQRAKGSGRKALNLPTIVERESDLPASGPDLWEVDLGPGVTEEVVLAAEPSVGAEGEAQVALEAQPQSLLAMTTARRDSMEVAVLTDDLLPTVDQQQGSLQLLEQQVVGGEQAKNTDLKEKHRRRKRYADERKKQLVAALQNSDEDSGDWVLLNVYDSIQEEVRAKSKLLEKMQRKLRAAEVEIKDLQSEFELEKIDYLATIRRQECDLMLFQQLLEQVQPLIRRDCNYSNLEKIRRESCWDEDNGFWKIPQPIILKTSLPQFQQGYRTDQPAKPPQRTTVNQARDSENIASNYFRPKRASQILSTNPVKSLILGAPEGALALGRHSPLPATQRAHSARGMSSLEAGPSLERRAPALHATSVFSSARHCAHQCCPAPLGEEALWDGHRSPGAAVPALPTPSGWEENCSMEALSRDGEADEAAQMRLGGDLREQPLGAPELWQAAQQRPAPSGLSLRWIDVALCAEGQEGWAAGQELGARGLTVRAALTFHAGDGINVTICPGIVFGTQRIAEVLEMLVGQGPAVLSGGSAWICTKCFKTRPSPPTSQGCSKGTQWGWGLVPSRICPGPVKTEEVARVDAATAPDPVLNATAQTRTNRLKKRDPPIRPKLRREAGSGLRAEARDGRNQRAINPVDWPRQQSCLSRIEPFPFERRSRAPLPPIAFRVSSSYRCTSGRAPRSS